MTEPLSSDGENVPDASDRSLLGRLRSGDDDAAHSLYMRYARPNIDFQGILQVH